jgi:hypothetical protein
VREGLFGYFGPVSHGNPVNLVAGQVQSLGGLCEGHYRAHFLQDNVRAESEGFRDNRGIVLLTIGSICLIRFAIIISKMIRIYKLERKHAFFIIEH